MKVRLTRALLLALVGLTVAGAAISSASAAHRFSLTGTAKLNGTSLKSSRCASTLGSCHMTGHLQVPDTFETWYFRGGTINIHAHGTTGAADHGKGTWTVTGGSGRFRHAKGSGTFAGYFHTATFTYTGSLRY